MKKLLTFIFALSSTGLWAQQSVLISPTGPEAIKFSNGLTEKITLFDNGPASKYGIGIQSGQFRQYVATSVDDFLFGVGTNTTFAEKFRIKGNGVIQTKNRITLGDAGGGESAGIWFNSNGNTGLNTFIGIDPSNKFGIYSPILSKNVFLADMANGGIRLDGPNVSSPTVDMLSLGGYGKVSIDAIGVLGGRMTILENGNVGIGTNAPAGPLTVSKTGGGGFALFQNQALGNSNTDGLYVGLGASGGEAYLYNGENSDLILGTNSQPVLKLNTVGNLQFYGSGKIVQKALQNVFFQNSWGNQNLGYSSAQYYKDKEGRVQLKGIIVNGTATPNGSLIFNLPMAYRSINGEQLVFWTFDGLTNRRIDIYGNGDVRSSSAGAALLFLDGISFRAD